MKSFVLLGILFAVVAFSQALSAEEKKAIEAKLAGECKTKEGATDDDVSELAARNVPSTPAAKCLHACMHEMLGLVKDSKASIDGAVELARMAYGGDQRAMDLAKEIAEDCTHINEPDRCELAVKLMVCAQDAAAKRGLNPKEMI